MAFPRPRRVPRRLRLTRREPPKPELPYASFSPAATGISVRCSIGIRIARRRPAPAISARIAAAAVIGVGNAGQKPPRGSSLALRKAGEVAAAQAGIFIALNADRISGPDGFGRRDAGDR